MKLIKFNTVRVDDGRMVHGTGRPMACHYTQPTERSADIFLNNDYPFTWKELEEFAVWLSKPEGQTPKIVSNLGLQFNNYERDAVLPILCKGWDMGDGKHFFNGDGYHANESNPAEVKEMILGLINPVRVELGNGLYALSITPPSGVYFETFQAIIMKDRQPNFHNDDVVAIIGLPEEYLISQFSSGFCKSGKWEHENGAGKHVFDGQKWENKGFESVAYPSGRA